jgi:hypothetical protein
MMLSKETKHSASHAPLFQAMFVPDEVIVNTVAAHPSWLRRLPKCHESTSCGNSAFDHSQF